jgi:hypothetical protein
MSGGKGGGETSTTTTIPPELAPYVSQAGGISAGTLASLANLLAPGLLSAPGAGTAAAAPGAMAAPVQQAQPRFGHSGGGAIAPNNGLGAFLNPPATGPALAGLSPAGAGGQVQGANLTAQFTPDQIASMNLARNFATDPNSPLAQALSAVSGVAGGGNQLVPGGVSSALATMGAGNGLNAFLDPSALSALQGVAGGSQLPGSEGFDMQLQAAINAALPAIQSTFRGGSGLGQASLGQSATDSFARLLGDAQNRQLNAAGQLGQFGLAGQQNQLSAAGLLGNLNQAQTAQQLQAALALPGLGMIPSQILGQIGGQQQAMNQANLSAPLNSLLQLLGAAQGQQGAFAPLFGRTQTTSGGGADPLAGILGAGLLAASLFTGGATAPLALGVAGGTGALAGIGDLTLR